ncbi:DNA polymerase III subunit gamma/tau [candidate division WOR-3 bacterium]|nr:DNA polymerase III subunit gamma/tau [candidate division WOR-3 bacterium]
MYQVFPLKYRPKTFDEVIGQTHVTQTLKNEVKYARIANSYLFAGPRGVGKTTTARIFAKALNCVNGPTPEPCNSCQRCKEIQLVNSLDVLEIDGASNRGIDEVRQLRERVKYAPSHGKYKIYIIDEVHMLTEEAFNALLKTIEEPPSHVLFILATTAPYKLPLTILSRCQRFNFRKVSPTSISEKIKDIALLESVEIDDSACSFIAKFVDGSLRDAISMLDQLIPYTNGKIKTTDIQTLLGLPPQTVFFELTDYIIKRDSSSMLALTQDIINQGIAPKELLSGLINHLQTIFLFKTGIPIPAESTEAYNKQVSLLKTPHILRLIKFLFDTEKNMRNALSEETYLQQALVRASICTQISIDEILTQLGSTSKSHGDTDKILSDKSPMTPKESESLDQAVNTKDQSSTSHPPFAESDGQKEPTNLQQIWKSLLQKVANKSPSLESFVAQTTPLKISNEELLIQYKNDFFKTKIEENLSFLENELNEIVNKPIHIIFEPSKSKKSLLEEPIVKTTIEMFNAEPVTTHK